MIRSGVYKHSKTGNLYRVHFVANHSEHPDDRYVVYECLYNNPESKYWIRPAAMFEEMVEINGKKVPRFVFVKE